MMLRIMLLLQVEVAVGKEAEEELVAFRAKQPSS